jgi:hypothetical protein
MIPGVRVTLGHSCTVQGTADVRIVYDSTAAKVIGPELLEVGKGLGSDRRMRQEGVIDKRSNGST